MLTANDRVMGALFHGWVELLVLFVLLFLLLTLWGWVYNLGFRPADRGSNTPWVVLLYCTILIAVLGAFEAPWTMAALLAGAVVFAGLASGAVRERPFVLPAVLLAALMGMGYLLSAGLLAMLGTLLLFFNTRRG